MAEATPVYPDPADVRAGINYGPTGAEYTGTLEAPPAEDPAATPDERAANEKASAEWSGDAKVRAEFTSRANFMAYRTAELLGRHRRFGNPNRN